MRSSSLLSVLTVLVAFTVAHAADPWSALSDAAEEKVPLAAQQRLEALLLEQPSFYPAHFNLGTLLMESERERAATHFERATSSPSPELVHDAWYNLALVRWKQGRLDDALAAAGKAVEIDGKTENTLKLRDELRRVALYRANEARKKAEAEAKKLRLPASDLPEAHVGEPYETRIHAAGGAGGYRFALGLPPTPPVSTPLKPGAAPTPTPTPTPTPAKAPPPPTLPPGLTLDADGRLHGTPTRDGRFPVALVVSDQAQASVSGTLMLVIQPAPAITTSELPEAILGSPYEALIDTVGLDRPTWTISDLPPGLSASTEPGPQLRISGTPTQATKATLTMRADDGKRHAIRGGEAGGPGPLTLTVSDSFAPDLVVLPPATAWAPYTHQLGVRGRPQAYRWSSPGAGGLKLDAQGLVSGTPEQAGDLPLPLTIQAEDQRSRTSTVRVPVNPPPVIEESQPLQFTVGQPAHRPLSVSGGTAPYLWQIADGVFPKGLRLDPDGTVRGVAAEPGEVDVTVAVSDRWQARSQHQIHLTVVEKPKDEEQQKQEDQQQQAKQDQQKQDQQKQDQEQKQDQQKQDQQKQDQAGKDDKNQQPQAGKDQQQQQDQQQQAGKDQQQDQQKPGGDQQQAADRTAKQAQALNQAAADRWLESLPKEHRDVLMYQLLEGGDLKPKRKGKAW